MPTNPRLMAAVDNRRPKAADRRPNADDRQPTTVGRRPNADD
jgi:hypothetical protein